MNTIKRMTRYLCILSFLGLGLISQAQTPKAPIPSSPDVAALEKFVEVPVSLYTGVPNISVPICNLSDGGLSVPISLAYHYTGFKPNETPGWVGMGWALNAGGVITRTVRGKPDEQAGGYWSLSAPVKPTYIPYDQANGLDDWHFLRSLIDNVNDGQPDVYSFNVGGATGKFFVEKQNDGSFKAYTIPYQDVKIDIPNNVFGEWKITLPNGVQYFFGGTGYTESTHTNTDNSTTTSPSSWYLTKMVSANGDNEINFTYQSTSEMFTHQTTTTQSIRFAQVGKAIECPATSGVSSSVTVVSVINRLHIKEITNKDGDKVVFTAEGQQRLDYADKALDKIGLISHTGKTIKTWDLRYDYLNSSSSNPNAYKRYLQLKEVEEISSDGSVSKNPYVFEYNNVGLTQLDKTSYINSIDHWGYYNGAINNGLIPSYTDPVEGIYYSGANREVNPGKVQVGIMTSLTSPTGGKTTFTWEPNIYPDYSSNQQSASAYVTASFSQATGSHSSPDQVIVIDQPHWVQINATITLPANANTAELSEKVRVRILKPNCGNMNDLQEYATYFATTTTSVLIPAGTYVLRAEANPDAGSYGSNDSFVANLLFSYHKLLPTSLTNKIGPGLRIKKVEMYDKTAKDNNNTIIKEYRYHTFAHSNKSSGNLMIPIQYHRPADSKAPRYLGGASCIDVDCFGTSLSSQSVVPSGYTKGSPIGYTEVTVLHGESGVNGREEYEYSFVGDNWSATSQVVVDQDWRRGDLIEQRAYDLNNRLLTKTHHYYNTLLNSSDVNYHQLLGITARWEYKSVCYPDDRLTQRNKLFQEDFALVSAWHRLERTESVAYTYAKTDLTGTTPKTSTTETKYYYESPLNATTNTRNAFVTKTEVTDSEGRVVVTKTQYPEDILALFSSGRLHDAAQLLVGKYMIGTPMVSITLQDNKVMGATYTEFAQVGTNNKIFPVKNYSTELLTPLTNELDIYSQDASNNFVYFVPQQQHTFDPTNGNLLQSQPEDNIPAAFLWGYKNQSQVIAHVVNAKTDEIAFSNFELNTSLGNWTVTGLWALDNGESHTGEKCFYSHSNTTEIKNAQVLPQQDYKISFWQKGSGAVTVNGQSAGSALKTAAGWSLYEMTVSGVSEVTLDVPQAVRIDDLRLHPVGAQMVTFTHQPLVGITSKTDAKHQTAYYVYDAFNRLELLKDFEGNIIKRYTYKYKNK